MRLVIKPTEHPDPLAIALRISSIRNEFSVKPAKRSRIEHKKLCSSASHPFCFQLASGELAPSELARFSIETDVGLRVAVLIDVIKRCGDLTSGRLP